MDDHDESINSPKISEEGAISVKDSGDAQLEHDGKPLTRQSDECLEGPSGSDTKHLEDDPPDPTSSRHNVDIPSKDDSSAFSGQSLKSSKQEDCADVEMDTENANSGPVHALSCPAQPSNSSKSSLASRRRRLAAALSGDPALQEISNRPHSNEAERRPGRIEETYSMDGKSVKVTNLDTEAVHYECSVCRREFGKLSKLHIHHRIHAKEDGAEKLWNL